MSTEFDGAISAIRRWMNVWDRVCEAADPDDKELPAWEEARKAMEPDFDSERFPTADHFQSYMHSTLVYYARDLLHASGDPLGTNAQNVVASTTNNDQQWSDTIPGKPASEA